MRQEILKKWIILSGLVPYSESLQPFIDSDYIKSPSDLYKLSERTLFSDPNISTEEVASIVEAIEKSKNVGLLNALMSLVEDLKPEVIQDICKSYTDTDHIVALCKDSVHHEYLKEEIERLLQLGVDLSFSGGDEPESNVSTPFTGKKVVISGILSASEDIVKEALCSLGAVVSDDVIESTDFLLIGENPGEVINKAVRYGVAIITEADVERMLGLV